jgi:two-component system, LuxR family, response regulator TtrR
VAASASRRVYVIDDDRHVRESTAFLLPALGYECTVFAAPDRFLGEAAMLAPGCILTDLRMPAMDGFELASAVRSRALDWPILMMTSDNGPELEQRVRDSGFSALLRKPVDGDLLVEALAQAFATLDA